MSERTFARPFGFLLVLLAALAALPGLARADEKDDLIRGLQEDKKVLYQFLEKHFAQVERLAQERKAAEEPLRARAAELEKQLANLKDQLVAAQIEARAMKARTEALLARLEEAQKELQKLRQGGKEPERPAQNPPGQPVQGAVTRVDEKSGLVTIDLGSDSGLLQGQTLEVFRLQPQPKYLGTLRLFQVRPTESVGHMIKPPAGTTLQAGDRVTSRFEGK